MTNSGLSLIIRDEYQPRHVAAGVVANIDRVLIRHFIGFIAPVVFIIVLRVHQQGFMCATLALHACAEGVLAQNLRVFRSLRWVNGGILARINPKRSVVCKYLVLTLGAEVGEGIVNLGFGRAPIQPSTAT